MAAIVDLQTQIAAFASATLGIPMGFNEAGVEHAEQTVARRTEAELQRDFNPLIAIDDSSDEEQAPAEVQDEHLSIAQLETDMHQQGHDVEEDIDLNNPEVSDVETLLHLGRTEPADGPGEVHVPEVENTHMSVEAQTPSQREMIAQAEERLGPDGRQNGDRNVSMEVTTAESAAHAPSDPLVSTLPALHHEVGLLGPLASALDSALRSGMLQKAIAEVAMGHQADETMGLPEAVVGQQANGEGEAEDPVALETAIAESAADPEMPSQSPREGQAGLSVDSFVVGQLVEMRDGDREWRQGYVTSLKPLSVCYKMDGPNPAAGYTFDEVRAIHEETTSRLLHTRAAAFSLQASRLQDEASTLLSAHETVLPIREDSQGDARQGLESQSRRWLSCALCSRRSQQASKRKAEQNAHESARKLQKQ